MVKIHHVRRVLHTTVKAWYLFCFSDYSLVGYHQRFISIALLLLVVLVVQRIVFLFIFQIQCRKRLSLHLGVRSKMVTRARLALARTCLRGKVLGSLHCASCYNMGRVAFHVIRCLQYGSGSEIRTHLSARYERARVTRPSRYVAVCMFVADGNLRKRHHTYLFLRQLL